MPEPWLLPGLCKEVRGRQNLPVLPEGQVGGQVGLRERIKPGLGLGRERLAFVEALGRQVHGPIGLQGVTCSLLAVY